ncbi:TadE-like protein [Motilibacter rhizosphaerae]|uniref:TadE-like protein n=1 Tax=Motilibacter rhizosphaerae TaxID=598652 RepID=A0A4Q7NSG1_9ACTN|nr:TadE/TadG family type IV pilus assembly protein [Motilibacter rhizosphaerae]RZS90066.1 TadE-like protein [Motilibacter rhizosphaerae]
MLQRVRSDDGSTLVEFVVSTTALAAMLLALVQVGVVLHVRTTLRAEAAEGARVAAAADRTPSDGADHARSLARGSFPRLRPTAASGRERVEGVPTVWVELHAGVPLVGWFAGTAHLSVRAHALEEGR